MWTCRVVGTCAFLAVYLKRNKAGTTNFSTKAFRPNGRILFASFRVVKDPMFSWTEYNWIFTLNIFKSCELFLLTAHTLWVSSLTIVSSFSFLILSTTTSVLLEWFRTKDSMTISGIWTASDWSFFKWPRNSEEWELQKIRRVSKLEHVMDQERYYTCQDKLRPTTRCRQGNSSEDKSCKWFVVPKGILNCEVIFNTKSIQALSRHAEPIRWGGLPPPTFCREIWHNIVMRM